MQNFPEFNEHLFDSEDDDYTDETEADFSVDWAQRSAGSPSSNQFTELELFDTEELAPEEENETSTAEKKNDTVKETKEQDLLAQLPKESLNAVQRAMLALSKVKPGEAILPDVRQQFETALKDAAKLDPQFAADQEDKLKLELRTKPRKLPSGITLPPWAPEKEKEYWEKKGAANKALTGVPEPTRSRVATLEIQRSTATDPINRNRLDQQINAALSAERSPSATSYALARRASEQFDRDNAMGLIRRNLHQQEMALLHCSQLCSGLYALAMERAGKSKDRRLIETHLQRSAFDDFTVLNMPELEPLREKYKVKEADPLDTKIPGRAELKEAVEIMRDERLGSMKQRLEKAEPLYQKAIEAADKIDVKKLDDELKAVLQERKELGEGGDPKKRDLLNKRAVELFEAVRHPGIARFAFAQALNHTAVEAGDSKLNERAINLFKELTEKEPGYQYDPLVQGFLKLASETPLKKVQEEEAIKAGEPIVEALKKEHKENGGGPKPEQVPWWREALGFIGSTAAFMAAWWALGKVFSPVGRYGSHLRRQIELSSRLRNLKTEASADLKPGDKPQLFYRDKEGKDHPVEGVRKEDGTLRIKKDGKTEVVAHKGELVLKHPAGEVPNAEQARSAAGEVLAPTSQEHEIENARKEAEQHKRESQKNLEDAQKKQAENEQLRKTIEELQQRLKDAQGESRASETGKAVMDKLPKRLREKLPAEYSADIKEAMERALEANREKWPEPDRKQFEKLVEDYGKQEPRAIEEVNRMLKDSTTAGEGRPAGGGEGGRAGGTEGRTGGTEGRTGGPEGGTGGAEGGTGGTEGGRAPGGEGGRPGGELHRTGGEHHTVEPRNPERVQAQAIETLTGKDGVKYIESIPIGELTVAKVEQKMKDIDAEIRSAKERGLHEYAAELEKMREEYHKQPNAKEKAAYCERAVERAKQAHEQAKSAKEGGGRGLAGKAGTVVAVLMVAGWLLDVTAPSGIGGTTSPRRVLPGKQ